MEQEKLIENQDSMKEKISKLSFKELKELAIQRNINPKLKKAQLVSALLGTEESITCDRTVCKEHISVGRVTRARASIFRNVDTVLSYPNPTNTNIEKNCVIRKQEISPTIEKEREIKTRGKRSKCDKIGNNHNLPTIVKPLSEITNTDTLLECNDRLRENGLSVNSENKLTEKEEHSIQKVTKPCVSENDTASNNQEVTSKRRGRRKKNVQQANNSIANNGITINFSENQDNEGEKTMKHEDVNFSTSIENISDIHVGKPKNIKRGRKGKKENETYSVIKNETDISTEESCVEKRFLSSQEDVGENKTSSKGSISKITDSNKLTSNSSEKAEPVYLNLYGESPNTTDEQELLKETSQSSWEVENMPFPAPVRGSTFVLENKDGSPPEGLKRSNTFTICNEDSKTKVTPNKNVNYSQKSIGARILSSSKKLGSTISAKKQHGPASILKKTITKNNATPGSVYKSKFGTAKKAPNFKTIHQKLFQNMESLVDLKKRKLERAEALVQSPIPRCAQSFQSPKWELKRKNESIVKPGMPQKKQTSAQNSPAVAKLKTPVANKIPTTAPKSATINRFGFNTKRVKREVANSIVGMKKPPIDMEKRKEDERALIQGVRMNKRFLLQMKMRNNMK